MNLADLLNARPLVPPEGAPNVRRHRMDGTEQRLFASFKPRQRNQAKPKGPRIVDSGVCLERARALLAEGPLTAPYLSNYGLMSLSNAKRILESMVETEEAARIEIRGVASTIYFISNPDAGETPHD